MAQPLNVGIKAIEIYFPAQCVDQAALEKYDGVGQGKYTIGLGQARMAFCDDREDIYSLALTVTSRLLLHYNIDTNSIGRLEVGTETLVDKSKSVKTVLMQLFKSNTNIEGADTINACYGGTSALFNAINWVESSAWDGRDSIVVAGDIAVYEKGPARPAGGAGIVAMLIGPNAPLVIDAGLRGSYMKHDYDFYKPDPASEYPIINGQYSLQCYIEALDGCYKAYLHRQKTRSTAPMTNGHSNGIVNHKIVHRGATLDQFNYFIFHSPVCKLVRKAYARLLFNDYLANHKVVPEFEDVPSSFREMDYAQSLSDKEIERTFLALTERKFYERVEPSLEVANMCGNLYCGSVYGSLASLLSNVDSNSLQGKKIGIFSHGGGLASSMFSLTVVGSTEKIRRTLCLKERLAARIVETPEAYSKMCSLREKLYLEKNYTPSSVWRIYLQEHIILKALILLGDVHTESRAASIILHIRKVAWFNCKGAAKLNFYLYEVVSFVGLALFL